jgi:hypothetical protein
MPDPLDYVDPAVTEAIRQGAFDDLPGKGKPLKLDPSRDAVVNSLLKEAGYKPEWAELLDEADALIGQAGGVVERYAADREAVQSELDFAPAAPPAAPQRRPWWSLRPAIPSPVATAERIAEIDARWESVLRRYADHLHRANRKLRRYNEIVPLAGRQRALIPVPERLQAFAERFPRLRLDPDGALKTRPGETPNELLTDPEREPGTRVSRSESQIRAARDLRSLGRRPPPIG